MEHTGKHFLLSLFFWIPMLGLLLLAGAGIHVLGAHRELYAGVSTAVRLGAGAVSLVIASAFIATMFSTYRRH